MQEALPREMYVDEATWRVERDAVLFGEWFCVGRLDALGLADAQRVAVLDVAGESVLVTSDEQGELHAAYNVCRHRGSQLPARPGRPAGAGGPALPVPLLDLRPRRPPAEGAARGPRRPLGVLARPGRGRDLGRVRLRAPVAGAGRSRWRSRSPTQPAPSPTTASADLVVGATFTYDVAANYKVILENYNECYHCGPVHPELSPAGAVVRRWRRATWTGRRASRTARARGPSRPPAPPPARRCPGWTPTSAPGTRAISSTPT